MEQKRQEEIGLILLKFLLRKEGLKIDSKLTSQFTTISKETKIPIDELVEFSETLAKEFLTEIFSKIKKEKTRETIGFKKS